MKVNRPAATTIPFSNRPGGLGTADLEITTKIGLNGKLEYFSVNVEGVRVGMISCGRGLLFELVVDSGGIYSGSANT
jgi:hypothetical protein